MAVVPVIAVDGPSGTGKGTVSARVAAALGWHLLDSGALYRAAAVAALAAGLDLEDGPAVAALTLRADVRFSGRPGNGETAVLLDGRDITRMLRTEEAGTAASRVAALPAVRAALLERQRAFRRAPGLVADGRDMGTVVFPDAQAKFFLTASPAERARRRYNQLIEKGLDVNLSKLTQDIVERDRRDSEREIAPLAAAADAIVLDTTDLGIEAVLDRVFTHLDALGLGADTAVGPRP
ncbi:MAG: (d)CMP kinase [Gammaproteobacteria bacterium]